jgi:hypothetical protein
VNPENPRPPSYSLVVHHHWHIASNSNPIRSETHIQKHNLNKGISDRETAPRIRFMLKI